MVETCLEADLTRVFACQSKSTWRGLVEGMPLCRLLEHIVTPPSYVANES